MDIDEALRKAAPSFEGFMASSWGETFMSQAVGRKKFGLPFDNLFTEYHQKYCMDCAEQQHNLHTDWVIAKIDA